MRPPIIVVDHGDILLFESAMDVEFYLAVTDVKNSEYIVYDSDDFFVPLEVIQISRASFFGCTYFIEAVQINDIDKRANYSSELQNILLNSFRANHMYDKGDNFLSLYEMIDKAVNYYGYILYSEIGKFPHYRRRSIDSKTGRTRQGQGISRHRPWDRRSNDKSFWDRF